MFFSLRDAERQRRFFLSLAARHSGSLERAYSSLVVGLRPGDKLTAARKLEFRRLLLRAVRRMLSSTLQMTQEQFVAGAAFRRKGDKDNDGGRFAAVVRVYLGAYAARKVVGLSAGAIVEARRILRRAAESGNLHEREVGVVLRRRFRRWSRVRAMRVARTETHSAANTASAALAEDAGLKYKRWSAAQQPGRTRPSHAIANGQLRAMNQRFIVGGARLRFPGDPSGPAREIVNCRCALTYQNTPPRRRRK